MKFAALSAALALVTLVNGMPTAAEPELEIRKKDKTGCDAFKKDLKKLSPAASTYCSSFIASTTTIIIPITTTVLITLTSTVPVTITTTQTSTAATPTVTQSVYPDCGVAGFDNQMPPAYFNDASGTLATFAACQAKCREAAGSCQSFAIGNGQCLLYQPNVVPTVIRSPTSPFTFYALNCPAPAPAPAPAVVPRQAAIPKPLEEYAPAERSALCSCAIDVVSTSTVLVSSTSTVAITTLETATTTVTAVVTTEVTPGPVTVTVTVSV